MLHVTLVLLASLIFNAKYYFFILILTNIINSVIFDICFCSSFICVFYLFLSKGSAWAKRKSGMFFCYSSIWDVSCTLWHATPWLLLTFVEPTGQLEGEFTIHRLYTHLVAVTPYYVNEGLWFLSSLWRRLSTQHVCFPHLFISYIATCDGNNGLHWK